MRLPWAVRNQSRLPEPQATGTVSAASLVHFDTRPLPSRAGSSYSSNCKEKPPAPFPDSVLPKGQKATKMVQNASKHQMVVQFPALFTVVRPKIQKPSKLNGMKWQQMAT